MSRIAVVVYLILCGAIFAFAQPSSDALALSLAQRSVASLAGGVIVGDATLNASVISVLGSGNETGTGTLQVKGSNESRVDISLSSSGIRSDVRSAASGTPGGAWSTNGGASTAYAWHNCWTEAAWFFPALSSLTQTANPTFIFKYVGQEQHGGINTEHIQVFQTPTGLSVVPQLSTVDFFLDAASSLPVAIGFNVHPDSDMGINISTEIDFSNYQPVNGIEVPFRIQQIFNGSMVLDITVTNAVFNTGLPDSLFAL